MHPDTMLVQRSPEILWALPDPVLVVGEALQIEYVNSAFEKMIGISLNQVRGKSVDRSGLEVGDEGKCLMQALEDFSRGDFDHVKNKNLKDINGQVLVNDPLSPKVSFDPYQCRPKINLNQKVYSYEIFAVPDSKESGSLTVVVFREITKDIEVNDQMVQAEKMSGLGTLAAGLAHELNNPLYTIIGFSEMILRERDKSKMDLIAGKIKKKSRELVAVLESLNSYVESKPIDGHMTVNINERLDAALEIALLTHESGKIMIKKNYSSLPFIKARADEVMQVFFNIITNAFQAMRGAGDLEIDSILNGKEIVVSIRDTGQGVPKEYIAKVFDPFFTTKDQGEGTGLGLTAAYQVVKKYDGRIKFNSVQGKGTTVEIYWPVKNGAVL